MLKMWLKLFLISFFGCHSILSHSFDVSGIVTGNRMAAVPLGRSLGEGELDIEGVCQESGMACQDCTHAVTCIPLPVGWLKVPLQQCSDGQTCNAHARQCSNETVPECDADTQKFRHVCEQVGIFPDAYDCRKFHLCSPPDGLPDGKPAEHRTALCPRHYGYDPRTAQCSIRLKNGQCNQIIVPKCTKVGQSDALASSPNHYYVCLSKKGNLYPQIFICPHGWYFWDNFCRPEPKIHQNNNSENQETQKSKEENTSSASREDSKIEKIDKNNNLAKSVPKLTYKVEEFFSTEKTTTYAADTFLADKFDLTNYETIDDVEIINNNDEFANSFEFGTDFW